MCCPVPGRVTSRVSHRPGAARPAGRRWPAYHDQVAVDQRDDQGELRALDRAVVAMVRQNEYVGRAQRHRQEVQPRRGRWRVHAVVSGGMPALWPAGRASAAGTNAHARRWRRCEQRRPRCGAASSCRVRREAPLLRTGAWRWPRQARSSAGVLEARVSSRPSGRNTPQKSSPRPARGRRVPPVIEQVGVRVASDGVGEQCLAPIRATLPRSARKFCPDPDQDNAALIGDVSENGKIVR